MAFTLPLGGIRDPQIRSVFERIAAIFPLGSQYLANNSVGSAQITDGAIVNADVNATAAIAYAKLNLANAVQTTDLVANAVTSFNQVVGVTSAPTTTSVADPMTAVVPDMTVTADFGGSPILIVASITLTPGVARGLIELYDNAVALAGTRRGSSAAVADTVTTHAVFTSTTGSRTYDLRWTNAAAATLTAISTMRSMLIIRLKR